METTWPRVDLHNEPGDLHIRPRTHQLYLHLIAGCLFDVRATDGIRSVGQATAPALSSAPTPADRRSSTIFRAPSSFSFARNYVPLFGNREEFRLIESFNFSFPVSFFSPSIYIQILRGISSNIAYCYQLALFYQIKIINYIIRFDVLFSIIK